eukprot:Hpha_TRINITY_DN8184_c0_g2::TRINITY_DN8184_c0_g2_i1::g.172051::m.172051
MDAEQGELAEFLRHGVPNKRTGDTPPPDPPRVWPAQRKPLAQPDLQTERKGDKSARDASSPTSRKPRWALWELLLWDTDTHKLVRQEVTRLLREEEQEQVGRGLPPAGRCVVPRQWIQEREKRAQREKAAQEVQKQKETEAITVAAVSRHHENVARQQAALQQREEDARELRRLVRELTREAQSVGPSSKQLNPALEKITHHLAQQNPAPRKLGTSSQEPISMDPIFPVPGFLPFADGMRISQPLRQSPPGVVNVYEPTGGSTQRFVGVYGPDARTRRYQLLCKAVHNLVKVNRLPARLASHIPAPPQGVMREDGVTEYAGEDLCNTQLRLTKARQASLFTSQRIRAAVRRLFGRLSGDAVLDPTAYVSFHLDLTAAFMPSFMGRHNIAVAEDELRRLTESGKALADWDAFFRSLFDWALVMHSREEFPSDDSFERFFDSIGEWKDQGGCSEDNYLDALESRKQERVGGNGSASPGRHSDSRSMLARAAFGHGDRRGSVISESFFVARLPPPRSGGHKPRGTPAGLVALEGALPEEYQHCMRTARDKFNSGQTGDVGGSGGIRFGTHTVEESRELFRSSAMRTTSVFNMARDRNKAAASAEASAERRGRPPRASAQREGEDDELDALLNYLAKRPSGQDGSAPASRRVSRHVSSGGSRRGSMGHRSSRASLASLGGVLAPRARSSIGSIAESDEGAACVVSDPPQLRWEQMVRRVAREQLRQAIPLPRAPGGGPASARPVSGSAAQEQFKRRYRPSSALGAGSFLLRQQRLHRATASAQPGPYGVTADTLRLMTMEAETVLVDHRAFLDKVRPEDAGEHSEEVLRRVRQLRLEGDDRAADALLKALNVLKAIPHRFLAALGALSEQRAGRSGRRREMLERRHARLQKRDLQCQDRIHAPGEVPAIEIESGERPQRQVDIESPGRVAAVTSRLLGRWPQPPPVPTGPARTIGIASSNVALRDEGKLERAVLERAQRRMPQPPMVPQPGSLPRASTMSSGTHTYASGSSSEGGSDYDSDGPLPHDQRCAARTRAVMDKWARQRSRQLELAARGMDRMQEWLRILAEDAGDVGAFEAIQSELGAARRDVSCRLNLDGYTER